MGTNNIDSKLNKIAGDVIKLYRLKKHMSLEEVVKKMKNPVSRQALYKYENNKARMKNSVFLDICNVLGKDPETIYSEINSYFKGESDTICDKNEINFNKYKHILTESDWNIINTIIEQRKKEVEK